MGCVRKYDGLCQELWRVVSGSMMGCVRKYDGLC